MSDARHEEIRLHFCQRCGISIPVADVESGRAPPAPGGFLCAGCVYVERDREWAPAGAPAAPAPAARRDGGSRALAAVALLYVVGASTFLLIREVNRKPPELILPATFASARDMQKLDAAVVDLDRKVRDALGDLATNDTELRGSLTKLQEGLAALRRRADETQRANLERSEKLVTGLLELTEMTVGLKRDIPGILEDLRGVRELVASGSGTAKPPSGTDPSAPGMETPPVAPGPSREEMERQRQLADYVRKLTEKGSSDQTRYNAAVQLGDLRDPAAIDPLMQALEKDPYDLVRRAAAWSLGMMGKEGIRAVPALIRQIGQKEEYVGYMCERALGEITKAALGAAVSFKYDPTMSQRERRAIQKKWEDWWEQNRHLLGAPG